MSITKKLVLMLALALTASAFASSSAFATATITPSGTYTGNENGPGTLASDDLGATITCDTSNFTAVTGTGGAPTATGVTVTSTAQTLLITGLTFGACTASVGGSCTVSVDTLPAKTTGNKVTTTAGVTTVATWTKDAATEAATISCGAGAVHCDASVGTALTGTADVNPQTNNTYTIVNQPVDIDDGTSVVCGTTATWNSSWTILSPSSYTVLP